MKSPTFGVRLPVAGVLASTEAITETAQAAEGLRFDAIWVHDFLCFSQVLNETHISCGSLEALQAAGDMARPTFFESLSNLAFLAGITKKVQIGIAVLGVPYRHPIIAAKQLATIDQLSSGRLIVGAGVGAPKPTHNIEFEALEIERISKYERTREYLQVMKRLWATGEAELDGDFASFPRVEAHPKPLQQPNPPLWISGGGEKALGLVAELGDGWFAPWMHPEEWDSRITLLSSMMGELGNDRPLKIATEAYISIDARESEAAARAEATIDALNIRLRGPALVDPDTRLVGNPDMIGSRIAAYTSHGIDHFELKFIYHSIESLIQQMTLFADEVIPYVTNALGDDLNAGS